MTLRINPSTVLRALLLIATILAILSFLGQFSRHALGHGRLLGMIDLFDVGYERNVPTFFSTALLLACSGLLALSATVERVRGSRWRWHWAALSLLLLYAALDESAGLHERLNDSARELLGASGALMFTWVVPGTALVVLLLVIFARFLFALDRQTLRGFLLAGFLFVGGAIGMETIGAWHFSRTGQPDLTFAMFMTIEEWSEMSGATVLAWTVMTRLQQMPAGVLVGLDPVVGTAAAPSHASEACSLPNARAAAPSAS